MAQADFKPMEIKCTNCDYQSIASKSSARLIIGLVMLVFGFLPGLVFFGATHPWSCAKCGKRSGLIRIYEDVQAPLRSFNWPELILASIGAMVIFICIFILKIVFEEGAAMLQ